MYVIFVVKCIFGYFLFVWFQVHLNPGLSHGCIDAKQNGIRRWVFPNKSATLHASEYLPVLPRRHRDETCSITTAVGLLLELQRLSKGPRRHRSIGLMHFRSGCSGRRGVSGDDSYGLPRPLCRPVIIA